MTSLRTLALLLSVLTAGVAPAQTGSSPGPQLAAPATPRDVLSGAWSGKVDWIDVAAKFTLSGTKVTGTFTIGGTASPVQATWAPSKGLLSLSFRRAAGKVAVRLTLKDGQLVGTAVLGHQTDAVRL